MAALAVLSLGLFMTLLDLTIVNIAIPSIIDGLHASLDQGLWVLNAYSLVYAVLSANISFAVGELYCRGCRYSCVSSGLLLCSVVGIRSAGTLLRSSVH